MIINQYDILDYTVCVSDKCPRKESCGRYTEALVTLQSYAEFYEYINDDECPFYK